jgi:hypothetical protein
VWLAGSVTPSFVSADAPDWAWDFRPQEGRVNFLAFCPRIMDREKELPECLKTASQQASKFERVTVSAGRSSRRVLLFTRHKSRVEAEFDCELAEDMRTRLVVVREHRSDEGTYLLAGLGLETVDPGLLVPTAPSPEWIEKGYSLPGFYTAVGSCKKRGFSVIPQKRRTTTPLSGSPCSSARKWNRGFWIPRAGLPASLGTKEPRRGYTGSS